jgi:hypothetical protein
MTDADRTADSDGPPDLRVTVGDVVLAADWVTDAPETRAALAAALPVEGPAARWGDELYVDAGVDVPQEVPTEEVPVGALAYWPAGSKLCLFWGPTPASRGTEPRATSPVTVVAQVRDVAPLAVVEGEARLRVGSADGDG